jgi:peptidoglycan hydrolase CwlO-like protein
MKRYISIIFILLLIIFIKGQVSAHPGNTDAFGGHYNRTTGEYHYHNSGISTSSNDTYTYKTDNSSSEVPSWLITDQSKANITIKELTELKKQLTSYLSSTQFLESSIKDKNKEIDELKETLLNKENDFNIINYKLSTLQNNFKILLAVLIILSIFVIGLTIKILKLKTRA